MAGLRDWIAAGGPQSLAIGGLAIGVVFGAVVYRTNFCTMGSLSDIVSFGDWRRFRAWMLAIAVAVAGAQSLDALGVVQLSSSMYLAPSIGWLGNVLGGLMFGYGMVFAGGCASRNLARVGGGDLRALLTLVLLGIFAYMAIGGILAPARAWLDQATAIGLAGGRAPTQSIADLLAAGLRIDPASARLAVGVLLAGGLTAWCLADRGFRTSPVHVVSGIAVGACAVAGWALTGLAFDEMADKPTAPISLTFVRPAGDTLEWLQRYTALGWPGFGVATVLGTLIGAFIAAKAMRRFQLTTFSDARDTLRSIMGAALMGVGGVLAFGCTVGQGITGVSTLAAGSFLTLGGIVAGGVIGIKALERGLLAEP